MWQSLKNANPAVIAALVGGAATVLAAIIGKRRSRKGSVTC